MQRHHLFDQYYSYGLLKLVYVDGSYAFISKHPKGQRYDVYNADRVYVGQVEREVHEHHYKTYITEPHTQEVYDVQSGAKVLLGQEGW